MSVLLSYIPIFARVECRSQEHREDCLPNGTSQLATTRNKQGANLHELLSQALTQGLPTPTTCWLLLLAMDSQSVAGKQSFSTMGECNDLQEAHQSRLLPYTLDGPQKLSQGLCIEWVHRCEKYTTGFHIVQSVLIETLGFLLILTDLSVSTPSSPAPSSFPACTTTAQQIWQQQQQQHYNQSSEIHSISQLWVLKLTTVVLALHNDVREPRRTRRRSANRSGRTVASQCSGIEDKFPREVHALAVVSDSRDDGGSGFILPSSALSVYCTIGCSLGNKGGGNDGISSRSAAASLSLSLSQITVLHWICWRRRRRNTAQQRNNHGTTTKMESTTSSGPGSTAFLADDPKMAYTEKVLEEKEQMLRKYIQDNYSKIQNVERELASLAMEVKLTAGPKKAALEHLRKLIEISSEKIKSARLKEEQARKVWEAAVKVVEAEESNKQRLCDDLKCLVQQSAEAQYSRLEELTQRLEALNPELRGDAAQLLAAGVQKNSSDSNVPHLHANQQSPHNGEGDNVTVSTSLTAGGIPKVAAIVASINSHQSPTALPSSPVPGSTPEPDGQGEGLDKDHSVGHSTPPVSHGQHVPVPRGRGQVAGRIRGSLRLGRSKSGTEGGEWTGAGFDVDDGAP